MQRLLYNGAVYRLAKAPVLDEQLLRPAWKALQPKIETYMRLMQEKVIDVMVEALNARLDEETHKFNRAASRILFDALIKELKAGTGGVDIASTHKIHKMAKALINAVLTGKVDQSVLTLLLGWSSPEVKPPQYRNMVKYFDPDQPEGAAYLKEVVKRLEPLL